MPPAKRVRQIFEILRVVGDEDPLNVDLIESLKKYIDNKEYLLKNYFDNLETRFENFLLVSRRFNSSTPAIPCGDTDLDGGVGGGYALSWQNKILVIDPGYNFIENIYRFGIGPQNIDGIILTHAHPDHTSDFENILTLLYEYNDTHPDVENKKIDVFMNLTSTVKFINLIKFHETVGNVRFLNINEVHKLEDYNIKIKSIKAKHNEFGSETHVIGLCFELYTNFKDDSKPKFKIGLTSDTGWYEGLSEEFTGVDILIAHIGGIKKHEITLIPDPGKWRRKYLADYYYNIDNLDDGRMNEYYYKNHLGLWGCYHLLSDVHPKLAILSEFGEEVIVVSDKPNDINNITDLRLNIAELLERCLQDCMKQTKVISSDIGLKINLESDKPKIQCTDCKKLVPPEEIRCTINPHPSECVSKGIYPTICYLCSDCRSKSSSVP